MHVFGIMKSTTKKQLLALLSHLESSIFSHQLQIDSFGVELTSISISVSQNTPYFQLSLGT